MSSQTLRAADHTTVAAIMTHEPVTVRPDLGLDQLVDLFLERNLSRVPVVDDNGKLIGIVSKSDLVIEQYMNGDTAVDQRGASRGMHVQAVGGVVRDIMSPVAFSIPSTMTIGAAARRLLADNVHAFPVVSIEGELVGMLSATDIVAWVAGL